MERGDSVPIIDFSSEIVQSTRFFAGRERIFKLIDDWLASPRGSHVFLLTGEPGSGKTALASRLFQFSQGIISPPDGTEHLGRDFLSAMHLCLARDSLKISPSDFTASLALQMAARYPVYAKALVEKNSDGKITISSTLNIEQVTGGQVSGITIKSLNLGGVTPEEAFNRAVLAPLHVLFQQSDRPEVVILVDGLDEALSYSGKPTIVALLSHMGDLPAGLRFILTSRQDDRVETAFLDADGLFLSSDEFGPDNHADVALYIEGRLRDEKALAERAAQLTSAHASDLITAINGRAAGNFRYVSFLLDSMALGRRSLTDLEGLPEGLDSLYYQSLQRIVDLGQHDWQRNYAPLMGILAVAQENLTLKHLRDFTRQSESMVRALLADLQQFVIEVEPREQQAEEEVRYRIYHQSVIDFLQRPKIGSKLKPLTNRFYLPPDEGHEQFVTYYRTLAPDWGSVHWWEVVGSYGLHHLPAHLAALRGHVDCRSDLYAMICKPYMVACRKHFGSYQFFAANVALAVDVAGSSEPPDLVQVIRGCLIYSTLGVLATSVPPAMLGVLARLDRLDTALGFAALVQNRETQSQAYLLVSEALLSQQRVKDARDALELALGAAELIAENGNGNKVALLNNIAVVFLRCGEKGRAVEAVQRVVTTSEAIGDAFARSVLLCDAAWQLAKVGEQAVALDLAKQSLQAAEAIEDMRFQTFALSKLAALWVKLGERERVEDAANQVVDLLEHDLELVMVGRQPTRDNPTQHALDASPQDTTLLNDDQVQDRVASEGNTRPGDTIDVERGHSSTSDDSKSGSDLAAAAKDEQSTLWPPGMGPGESSGLVVNYFHDYANTTAILSSILHVQEKWELEDSWNRQWVLNDIIKCLTLAACYEQALAVANLIQDEKNRASATGIIISTLGANSEQGVAARVAEMALDRLKIIDDPGARVTALVFIAEMLLKGQEKDRAREVIDMALQVLEMIAKESDKALPMSSMTQALYDLGDQDRAQVYAGRVVEIAGTIEDGFTKGLVAQYLAHAGQLDRSEAVIEMIGEQEEKAVALSALSQMLVRAGDKAAAAIAADKAAAGMEAFKAGGRHGFRQADVVMNQVLQELTAAEQFRQAVRVAETISNEYARVVAKSNIAHCMLEAGQREQAGALMDQLLASQLTWSRGDSAVVLGKIALLLARQGNHDRAQAIAGQIVEQAKVIWDEGFMIRALLQAIDVLTLIGQFELALPAAQTIENEYWRAIALSKLVQAGERISATTIGEVFDATVQIAMQKNPGDKWDKTWALCDIAYNLTQTGQHAVAARVVGLADAIDEYADRIRIPSRLVSSLPHNANESLTWVQVEAMGDHYWMAFLFLTDDVASSRMSLNFTFLNRAVEIGYTREKAAALSKVGSILALSGEQDRAEAKFSQAVALARGISEPRIKVIALSEVAQILVQAGRVDLAKGAVRQALSTLETLGEKGNRLPLLIALAGALVQTHERSEAVALASRAVDVAKKIGQMYFRAMALHQSAIVLAQAGETDLAFTIAKEIEYVPYKLSAMAAITVEMARTSDVTRAINEVGAIPDEGTQAQVRGDIAEVLASTGQCETAQRVLLAALTSTRRAGRVLDVLDRGANALNVPGQGQRLWNIYETMQEVDNWWWS